MSKHIADISKGSLLTQFVFTLLLLTTTKRKKFHGASRSTAAAVGHLVWQSNYLRKLKKNKV